MKPTKPVEPTPPQEFIEEHRRRQLVDNCLEINLAELTTRISEILSESAREGVKPEDVKITVYTDYESSYAEVCSYYKAKAPNQHYAEQLSKHNKALKAYEVKLKNYEKLMEEYKLGEKERLKKEVERLNKKLESLK